MPGAARIHARTSRGVALAIAAYAAWGFLSPIGQILLGSMGPFTLNAVRTLLALPVLFLLFGPRVSQKALAMVRSDRDVWVVGVVWLGLTFIPYLWSLKYLPATITTLTVYLAPLLVAAWQRIRHGERVSALVVPTVVLTLVGGALATRGPGGVPAGPEGWLGLALALLGVVGWTGYTVHLKSLTRTRDANALTLAAFATSSVVFVAGAAVVERFAVAWTPATAGHLALYVALPTVVSFWLYTLSLKHAPSTTVAVLIGVELVSTAVVSRFFTDEVFTAAKVAGLAIVVAAVTLFLWAEKRAARRAAVAAVA